jgi:hypothetical protein
MSNTGTILGAISLALLIVFTSAGCGSAQDQAVNVNNAIDQDRHRQAAAELKRLTDLRESLSEIPFNGDKKEPYASLIKEHEDEIVYNEPAGQWIVRAEKFWELSERYKDLPIGDDIAWTAATNPIPGECEGFVTCSLFGTRITLGKYLEAFPNGKHREDAMREIGGLISDMVRDMGGENPDMWPTDAEDKQEFGITLDELEAIIAKTDSPQKAAVLAGIEKLRAPVS